MFRFIFYAIIIYLVYLAIKWAFRLGAASGRVKSEKKKFEKQKSKPDLKNIEDAEFTEIKKD